MHVDVVTLFVLNAMGPPVRVRHSLQYIQQLYDSGEDRSQLENLIRAFRGIQALPPDDPKSFFHLGGLHGLPYRGPGETDPDMVGRVLLAWQYSVPYLASHLCPFLEDALRSVPGCQDVTIPFWDELVNLETTRGPVIPSVLTSPTFELDGRTDNPLYSYKLQKGLLEDAVEKERYSKPEGYKTVRYPLSGEYRAVAAPAPCYSLRMLIFVVY
jgi:tyrosinase